MAGPGEEMRRRRGRGLGERRRGDGDMRRGEGRLRGDGLERRLRGGETFRRRGLPPRILQVQTG